MLYFTKIEEINISLISWLLQIFPMSIILFANCSVSISSLTLMLFDPICTATISGLSFFVIGKNIMMQIMNGCSTEVLAALNEFCDFICQLFSRGCHL